jgi:hypothetical protein
MAHEVISLAGEVLDVLRSEIGASATGKKTEDDFLRGVQLHLRGILRSARKYLEDWNYLDDGNVREFRVGVKKLLTYVDKTLATPYDQRGEPEFK